MKKYITLSVALIFVMGFISICVAQEGVGVPKPPPASGKSFGIDFGISRNTQQGSFSCPCGTMFTSGSGNGFSGSLYFELPAARDLFVGLKAGFEQKSTSNTQPGTENVVIETPQGDTTPVSMAINRVGMVTLSFINFEPFAQYQVLHTNFFVQLGAGVSMLASSSLSQKREMTSGSITLSDGSTINNLTFTNGTRTEDIPGSILPEINSPQFSGVAAAGYNFVMGRIILAPMVTYDFPFSNISNTNSNNWKITSLYGSIELGFSL